jgi:hypothetical protein
MHVRSSRTNPPAALADIAAAPHAMRAPRRFVHLTMK